MPSADDLKAGIKTAWARGKEAARPFREEADRLQALLDGPYVEPVVHYWRHHRLCTDSLVHSTTLKDAYEFLAYSADDGRCSPHGVSVGGHFTSYEDLRERFGEVCD